MRSYRISSLFFISALVACAGAPDYPKCEKDAHCEEKGEVCVEGTCQQCRDAAQCEEGQICQGGRCAAKPECSTDEDCTGNQSCRSGQCQLECESDSQCGGDLRCHENRCTDQIACDANGNCPSDMLCRSGMCTDASASRSLGCQYPTIRFAFNESRLEADAQDGLREAAECIRSGTGTLILEGHADERGTEEYNLALGDRRARSVMKYLRRLGVPSDRMQIVSKGETEPLDPASNEDAWAKNRRTEFVEQ